jgi:hypothetical protein
MDPAPDKMSVQVDERARLELLTGCAQRTLGNSALGHVGALKEVIQFPLERAFDQVQQEQEHDLKHPLILYDSKSLSDHTRLL